MNFWLEVIQLLQPLFLLLAGVGLIIWLKADIREVKEEVKELQDKLAKIERVRK